ncbi:hypothetical protein MKZ38_000839 [Zalerion maritima]|uniref:Uncharacterized protein n=1 Tax=Zalerion maritima TaxID=339359 RepID=A0AAD5RR08_9PEZI|nr:hypothetical protein MKZ38_000839 [Zalerion maritima]
MSSQQVCTQSPPFSIQFLNAIIHNSADASQPNRTRNDQLLSLLPAPSRRHSDSLAAPSRYLLVGARLALGRGPARAFAIGARFRYRCMSNAIRPRHSMESGSRTAVPRQPHPARKDGSATFVCRWLDVVAIRVHILMLLSSALKRRRRVVIVIVIVIPILPRICFAPAVYMVQHSGVMPPSLVGQATGEEAYGAAISPYHRRPQSSQFAAILYLIFLWDFRKAAVLELLCFVCVR